MNRFRFALIAILALCSRRASAQEFYNLTAEQVRIDTLLPRFACSFPLAGQYADSAYSVAIEYPRIHRHDRGRRAPLQGHHCRHAAANAQGDPHARRGAQAGQPRRGFRAARVPRRKVPETCQFQAQPHCESQGFGHKAHPFVQWCGLTCRPLRRPFGARRRHVGQDKGALRAAFTIFPTNSCAAPASPRPTASRSMATAANCSPRR